MAKVTQSTVDSIVFWAKRHKRKVDTRRLRLLKAEEVAAWLKQANMSKAKKTYYLEMMAVAFQEGLIAGVLAERTLGGASDKPHDVAFIVTGGKVTFTDAGAQVCIIEANADGDDDDDDDAPAFKTCPDYAECWNGWCTPSVWVVRGDQECPRAECTGGSDCGEDSPKPKEPEGDPLQVLMG